MKTNAKLLSANQRSGTNQDNHERREEWILTAKLFLLAIAIFAAVIVAGFWQ